MSDAVRTIRDDLHPDRWPEVTAVQEIQAAIDKLTQIRAQSTPGPWDWDRQGVVQSFDISVQVGEHEHERIGVVALEHVREGDAALIVTLHRTIDAQLAILTDGLADMMSRERLGLPLNTGPVRTLALARAINGVMP